MFKNHPKLTQNVVENTPRAMIAMLLVSFVYIWIFIKFIPLDILSLWFAFQVLLALFRFTNAKTLKKSLEQKDDIKRRKHEIFFLVSNIFQADWVLSI